MIHSYPSVYALGHKAIEGIFDGEVIVEEKIDGSQFSFGVIEGELEARSKNKQFIIGAHEKMFDKAIAWITENAPAFKPNWVYRGEFLGSPKHNTLAYDRVPANNIILYDISPDLEAYLTPEQKAQEATRIGLECVPLLFQGKVDSVEMFQEFLDRVSILGGTKIEGVVVKNYSLFTAEKKVAMGKYVSEKYKEIAGGEWRKSNPTQRDIVDQLITRYRTPARWQKAVQHLRDAGTLEGSPRDIGNLLREVQLDVLKECKEEMQNILLAHFLKSIQRGIVAGLPEWYKEQLLEKALPSDENKID